MIKLDRTDKRILEEIQLNGSISNLELAEKYKPKFRVIKDHAMYLTKGFKEGRVLRNKISQVRTIEEIEKILQI